MKSGVENNNIEIQIRFIWVTYFKIGHQTMVCDNDNTFSLNEHLCVVMQRFTKNSRWSSGLFLLSIPNKF